MRRSSNYVEKLEQSHPIQFSWGGAIVLFVAISIARFLLQLWMTSFDWHPEVLWRSDGIHYLDLAINGYPSLGQTDLAYRFAFFPALPMLMHLLMTVFSIPAIWAGLLISNFFGVVTVAGVFSLTRLLGGTAKIQIVMATLFLGAPMAVTLNMIYTESMFWGLVVWICYFTLKNDWWKALLLIFLLGFVRLTAIDVWLAFGITLILYHRKNWLVWLAWLASVSSFVGYITFASSRTLEKGGYFGVQKQWNSEFDFGRGTLGFLSWELRGFDHGEAAVWRTFCCIFIIFALIVMAASFRRLPWILWLSVSGIMLNVILSDGVLESRPRLMLGAVLLLAPLVFNYWSSASCKTISWILVPWLFFGTWISNFACLYIPMAI